ncbi:MAG TPA: divalent-cation tolerance protein CutA [Gemmatimonadales bacterium]|nr:divalent-cation tolerance protein CutA [Gemmatimonadales bacterium]HSE66096.1 divalent-cation tolerance protein CutA [Gemmatimonadales bacterium]
MLQVTTTVPSEELARRIAETVVAERLAACAQILGPITSVYRWQGAIEQASEWYCQLKTTTDAYPGLEARLRSLHPYEVPEIIATPIVFAAESYAVWVGGEVGSK